MVSYRNLLSRVNIKEIVAYSGLGLFFAGWAAFVLVFIQLNSPPPTPSSHAGATLEMQRQKAIEQAKKEGKKEYSFTTNTLPIPMMQ